MSRTLLLADDSVTIQKIVGLTFASEEIRLVTVDNGDDALIRARAFRPDLILADVNMPGLSGYELCAAIRDDNELKDTPVLLLTGAFERVDERLAEESGVSDFIAKPFEAHALVSKVEALLRAAPQPAHAADPVQFESAPQVESGPADQPPLPSSDAPDAIFGDDTMLYQEPITAPTRGDHEGADQEHEDAPVADVGTTDPFAFPGSAPTPGVDPFHLESLPSSEGPLPDPPAESSQESADAEPSPWSPGDSGSGAFGELPLAASGDSLTAWATGEFHEQREATERPPLDPLEMPPLDRTGAPGTPEAAGNSTLRGRDPESVPASPSGRSGQSDRPGRSGRSGWAGRDEPDDGSLERTAVFPASEPSDPSDTTATRAPTFPASTTMSGADKDRLAQEVSATIEKLAWDAFGPLSEQIVSQVVRKVEEIAWEAVPEIAERLVRAEIERLKGEEDPEA